MRVPLFLFLQITLVFGHGALDEQIAKVSSQITATPNDPKLWIIRADLHQSHRDPQAALSDLRQAIRIEPYHPPAFLKMAQFQRKNGNFDEARKALKTYSTLFPESTPDPLAHREHALLSPPKKALHFWKAYLNEASIPAMHDFALAAQTAIDAPQLKTAQEFILTGLNHHPKSIKLHQFRAQIALARNDSKTAEASFKILKQLYPNLLVKLNYEESLLWTRYQQTARSRQALRASLEAYKKLPPRLKKNRDLQVLVLKIESTLAE